MSLEKTRSFLEEWGMYSDIFKEKLARLMDGKDHHVCLVFTGTNNGQGSDLLVVDIKYLKDLVKSDTFERIQPGPGMWPVLVFTEDETAYTAMLYPKPGFLFSKGGAS